ncbi:MAG: hypothetical protein PF961_04330 [Planctomycetota bacterium]|nr:hypothetical protein [Planctomycetota bacterium]
MAPLRLRHRPYQQHNLIGDPRTTDTQAACAAHLHQRLAAVGDEFLPDGAYAKRWGYPVGPGGTLSTRG